MKDLFALQDELTRRITGELLGELTEGEIVRRLVKGGTKNGEALTLWFRALKHLRRFNKNDNLRARELAQQAIALDADFSDAHSMVAWSHALPIWFGFSDTPKEDFARAAKSANQALKLDSANPDGLNVLGNLRSIKGEQEKAIGLFREALSISPNHADSHYFLGRALRFNGQPAESIESIKTAMRISPFYPEHYLSDLAISYLHAGQYEKAISAVMAFRKRKGDPNRLRGRLSFIYAAMGRVDEARAEMEKKLKIDPKFSIGRLKKRIRAYRDPKIRERIIARARLAGMPE